MASEARGSERDGRGRAPDHVIESTRTSRAWAAAGAGLVLLLLGAIFIAQNGEDVELEFLWWSWNVALGVGLLFAAVIGGLAVLMLGIARMVQLRRSATRHRRADEERDAWARSAEAGSAEAGSAEEPPPPS